MHAKGFFPNFFPIQKKSLNMVVLNTKSLR